MKLNYAWTVFVYLLNNTSSLIVLNILNCLLILLILNINYKCSQYPNIVAVNFRLTNLRLKIKYKNFSFPVCFFNLVILNYIEKFCIFECICSNPFTCA